MRKTSFLLIAAIASLFIYNNAVAQITLIKTITPPKSVGQFLGAANMDNDPQQELVYFGGYPNDNLVIIDGITGNIDWEMPATLAKDIDISGNGGAFCDINNDGKMEITFSSSDLAGKTPIYIVGLQGALNIIGNNNSIPTEVSLMQNYPNPFNPITTIEYQIQKADYVTIKIFDSIGRLVKNLVNEEKQSGEYSVIFNGRNDAGQTVSSGVYYYQLQVGDFVSNKKMILLK